MVKKGNSMKVEKASNDAFNELEQLRLIVFGQAKQELEQKIEGIKKHVETELKSLKLEFSEQIELTNQNLSSNFSDIQASIHGIDEKIDKHQELNNQDTQKLLSQLEMAENEGKDDTELLHKRIDSEVSKLENAVDSSIQDILAQLEKVSSELSSSKTDRKTLAKLLSNMANNLNEDS